MWSFLKGLFLSKAEREQRLKDFEDMFNSLSYEEEPQEKGEEQNDER